MARRVESQVWLLSASVRAELVLGPEATSWRGVGGGCRGGAGICRTGTGRSGIVRYSEIMTATEMISLLSFRKMALSSLLTFLGARLEGEGLFINGT